MKNLTCCGIATILALTIGCSDQDTSITTDMHDDFDHEHKHQHSANDDHEHEHRDQFEGSHSHGHSHSHRHGEPLHGGQIVSIGHTHHQKGATHFHAEILPINDDTIRFHLLSETEDGKSADYPIPDKQITAIVSIKGKAASGGDLAFFAAGDGDTSAEFALAIPQQLTDGHSFSVVIPKLKLNGHRQNFSFTATRAAASGESLEAAAQKVDDE